MINKVNRINSAHGLALIHIVSCVIVSKGFLWCICLYCVRVNSLAMGQSRTFPSASEISLKNMHKNYLPGCYYAYLLGWFRCKTATIVLFSYQCRCLMHRLCCWFSINQPGVFWSVFFILVRILLLSHPTKTHLFSPFDAITYDRVSIDISSWLGVHLDISYYLIWFLNILSPYPLGYLGVWLVSVVNIPTS